MWNLLSGLELGNAPYICCEQVLGVGRLSLTTVGMGLPTETGGKLWGLRGWHGCDVIPIISGIKPLSGHLACDVLEQRLGTSNSDGGRKRGDAQRGLVRAPGAAGPLSERCCVLDLCCCHFPGWTECEAEGQGNGKRGSPFWAGAPGARLLLPCRVLERVLGSAWILVGSGIFQRAWCCQLAVQGRITPGGTPRITSSR